MFDVGSATGEVERSHGDVQGSERVGALQRMRGTVRLAVARRGGRSRLAELYQSGAGKCLLPRSPNRMEAVLLNTAGGITGGDRLRYDCTVSEAASLAVTTQAAERVYRSTGDDGHLAARLRLGAGADLRWLPQETILFEGGRLRRSLEVEMAADATLLALDSLVLGRRAMGETLNRAFFSDQWRLRRAGKLIYADALRLTPPVTARLASPATAAGSRALATLIYVAPEAEARRDGLRDLLQGLTEVEAAASAWNGLLCLRFLARDGAPLRRAVSRVVSQFCDRLPRVWSS